MVMKGLEEYNFHRQQRKAYNALRNKFCKSYIKGGLCSHLDAPKPPHSRCIGSIACKNYKVEEYKKDSSTQ